MPRRTTSAVLILSLLLTAVAPAGFAQDGTRQPYHNPYLRAFESLAIPGLGQWHNGDANRGALWFGFGLVALAFASEYLSFGGSENNITFWRTAGWVAYGLDATVSAYSAYRAARELNRENGYDIDDFSERLLHGQGSQLRVTLLKREF